MAVDKTYDAIREKYYIPNLYKKLIRYIEQCIICQTRSSRKSHPPVQETEFPLILLLRLHLTCQGLIQPLSPEINTLCP